MAAPMTSEQANVVYDVLVEHADALGGWSPCLTSASMRSGRSCRTR